MPRLWWLVFFAFFHHDIGLIVMKWFRNSYRQFYCSMHSFYVLDVRWPINMNISLFIIQQFTTILKVKQCNQYFPIRIIFKMTAFAFFKLAQIWIIWNVIDNMMNFKAHPYAQLANQTHVLIERKKLGVNELKSRNISKYNLEFSNVSIQLWLLDIIWQIKTQRTQLYYWFLKGQWWTSSVATQAQS